MHAAADRPTPVPATSALADRRSTPRVEVISRVQGEAGYGDTVLLINISEGGAMVHGNFPAEVGEVHEFRFLRPHDEGTPLVFAARVVRVLHVAHSHETTWALGLEFVTTTEHQRQSINALLSESSRARN